jgi:hypothetical protein
MPIIKPLVRSRKISLALTITNGNPQHDCRLRFDFKTNQNQIGQVWMARLPKIKNADAFPRQLGPNHWGLSLDAVGDTQPLEVISYTPQDAHLWLQSTERQRPPHTELLVLAHHNTFSVSLTDHE